MSDENHKTPQGKVFKSMDPPRRWQWGVLVAVFILQMQSMGLAYSAGVFFIQWLFTFQESKSLTAWIISVNIAIIFGSGPFVSAFTRRFSYRKIVMLGSLLTSVGLFSSAFAQNVYHLYASYGCLTGIGIGLVYLSSICAVNDYFKDENRSFALTCTFTGAGSGGMLFPTVFNLLNNYYGWRGCLIISSGITLQGCFLGALLRPSDFWVPKWRRDNKPKTFDFKNLFEASLLKEFSLYVFCFTTILWQFGIAVYLVLLIDFAQFKGTSPRNSTWLLFCYGLCSTMGRICVTIISKYRNLNNLVSFIACCILTGLLRSLYPVYYAYWWFLLITVLYGLVQGGMISLIPVVLSDLFGPQRVGSAFGYTLLSCCIGTIGGPPFAGWLFDVTQSYDIPFYIGGAMTVTSGILLCLILCQKKKWTSFHLKDIGEDVKRKIKTELDCEKS